MNSNFIEQLKNQDYAVVTIPDYAALVDNFKVQFEKFNAAKLDKPLSEKEWERIFNHLNGKSIFESAKILRDKYVLEREWHKNQQVEQQADGSVVLKFTSNQKQMIFSWVMGFGDAVTVIAPSALREQIKAECGKIAEKYANIIEEKCGNFWTCFKSITAPFSLLAGRLASPHGDNA